MWRETQPKGWSISPKYPFRQSGRSKGVPPKFLNFPNHPLVVQKINIYRVDYPCACGKCIHSGFIRSGYIVHFAKLILFDSLHIFHLHFMHSPQHRTASVVSFLSIPQAPLIQSVTIQALFQRTSNGIYFFCDEFTPIRLIPFGRAEKRII